jgi:hypothetical protein
LGRKDSDHPEQVEIVETVAELGAHPVAGIRQDVFEGFGADSVPNAPQLVEGDLPFGSERYLVGNASLAATRLGISPVLRQI